MCGNISAQYFAPAQFIVNADNLRLRSAPHTNSKIIDVLNNGEILEFLEFAKHPEPGFRWYELLGQVWVKVNRVKDGQSGYVSGQYIQPAELGLKHGQNFERMPLFNWYGITLENEVPILTKTTPEIIGAKYQHIIVDTAESYVFIGSKDTYSEGSKNGTVFHNERLMMLYEGMEEEVGWSNVSVKLEVCHDYDFNSSPNFEIKERLFISVRNKENKEILYQELTDQFLHLEHMGFWIHFVGDLNGDGLPEIFMSELSEKAMRNLWFSSNGKMIELKSITTVAMGC